MKNLDVFFITILQDLSKPKGKAAQQTLQKLPNQIQVKGTGTHGNGTMKTLKASVWPPLQLASELRQVLSVMAVRAPIMADSKEKK